MIETNKCLSFSKDQLETLLDDAAQRGARRALADVGLEGYDAAEDIRTLRGLIDALRIARRTACQTIVRIVTTAILASLIAGIALKLKLLGGGQ
jgi:hypothetical protein